MNRFCMAILPLIAMASTAFAQDGTGLKSNKANTETVGVTVTGDFDWDVVSRDGALTSVRGNSDGDSATGSAEATHHVHIRVGLDVDLSEKVKIKVNLETRRFANGSHADIAGDANGSNQVVFFRETNITFAEIFDPAVTVVAGTHTQGYGRFFNPANSASILNNIDGPTGSFGIATARDQQLPAGVIAMYNRESIHVNLALLPVIILDTGFAKDTDEGAYALNIAYDIAGLGKGSAANVIIILHDTPDTGAQMYSFGGGVTLNDLGMPGLSVSAEVLVNSGVAIEQGGGELDAGGMGIDIRVHHNFEHELQPWVEVAFTSLSGDDDLLDTDVDSFLSYEDIRDLMIIEDGFYGLDVDSNLMAIKISGGAAFSIGQGKNNLVVRAIVGICTANEDIGAAPNEEDAWGTEFDVTARYNVSRQVAIHAGVGVLTGSDLLETLGGGPANDKADDGTMVFTGGIDAGF